MAPNHLNNEINDILSVAKLENQTQSKLCVKSGEKYHFAEAGILLAGDGGTLE
jgi:hypothetical protein